MLSVRARLAPLDRSRRVRHLFAVLVHALAVGLHVHLLQIGREARQVLVVRQHAVALGAVAVRIQNAQQRQNDRHVLLERRRAEVAVHLVVSVQKTVEVLASDGDHQRKPDGRGKRIAPADPVPESEHVLHVDAERRDFLLRRRDRHEVLGHRLLIAQTLDEPRLGRLGVGHRLLRRERLRGDDEQRLVGLDLAERLRQMGRIDVGNEVVLQRALRVGRERDVRHDGTQIAAADADVHHIFDLLARVPAPRARTHRVREIAHARQNVAHVRHDVVSIDENLRFRIPVAQCRVEHRAILRHVDFLAREHLLDLFLEMGGFRQRQQRLHRLRVDAVLGIVQEPPRRLERKLLRTARILGKQFFYRLCLVLVDEFIDFFPCFRVHFFSPWIVKLNSVQIRSLPR